MEVAQHPEINDFDWQVLELEATITRIDLRNDEMKQALKKHLTSLAALEVNYNVRIALLTQRRSQDTQPLLDRMQTAVLQDLDAEQCLHQQVTNLQHRSVPLEDEMATLMRRVGGIMNQQGTVNVQSQALSMLEWL